MTNKPEVEQVPQCRECGEPSPFGDPCETCTQVARILAMSDEEVLASMTPEDFAEARDDKAWIKGLVQGFKIGSRLTRAQPDAQVDVEQLAHVVDRARYWPGEEHRIRPFEDQDERGKEYSRRIARAVQAVLPTPKADVAAAVLALRELEAAVGDYRMKHDLKGDGSPEAGRAWDLMKRAQHRARFVLAAAPTPDPVPETEER